MLVETLKTTLPRDGQLFSKAADGGRGADSSGSFRPGAATIQMVGDRQIGRLVNGRVMVGI